MTFTVCCLFNYLVHEVHTLSQSYIHVFEHTSVSPCPYTFWIVWTFYCLNGLKIKDDGVSYTRYYVRTVVYKN
jgi:hypothetical protein